MFLQVHEFVKEEFIICSAPDENLVWNFLKIQYISHYLEDYLQ